MGSDRELSPEEIEANELLSEASKEIERLEKEIAELPDDRHRVVEHTPFGNRSSTAGPLRSENELKLKEDQEAIKKSAEEKINEIADRCPGDIKERILIKLDDFNNPKNDLQKSQNRAMEQILDAKQKGQSTQGKSEQTSKEAKPMAMSSRFVTTLNYSSISQMEVAQREKVNEKSQSPLSERYSKTLQTYKETGKEITEKDDPGGAAASGASKIYDKDDFDPDRD